MLRVYLDQWVWVNLTRVAHGAKLSDERMRKPLADVLEIARHGVKAGLLSFPLSTSHYIETYGRYSWQSRYRLARMMADLSRFDVILSAARLLPSELDAALKARFGRPQTPRSVDVFGRGIAYAFGQPDLGYTLPGDLPIPEDLRPMIQAFIGEKWEFAALAGPDEDGAYKPPSGPDGQSWVGYEEDVARRLAEAGFTHKPNQFLTAVEWVELIDPYNEACRRAGLNAVKIGEALGPDGLEEMMLSMPCRGTIHRVRREQHKSGRKRVEGDVRDMEPLGVAAVHCDVVVAEKYHGGLLVRTGADKRFGTTIVTPSTLPDLPSILVASGVRQAG